ncbi:DinB family protein [Paenibacillus sp. YYML68]|uniref:DinB family protein n=1 Tax=Paenibacillus sp. YYML68 TaxID=2909250 RepID=UPI00248F5AB2|nr:DinB family protein [Paenibacillus sp. YYML68]
MMEELVRSYEDGYNRLLQALDGVSEELLMYKPAPDKWSIKEVVIHVCDAEVVAVDRMKRVISEPNQLFFKFDPDAWAVKLRYQELDMQPYLTLLQSLRSMMTAVLEGLSEEDWARTGVHNIAGKVTLKDLVTMFANHIDVHVRQIERNKQSFASCG